MQVFTQIFMDSNTIMLSVEIRVLISEIHSFRYYRKDKIDKNYTDNLEASVRK